MSQTALHFQLNLAPSRHYLKKYLFNQTYFFLTPEGETKPIVRTLEKLLPKIKSWLSFLSIDGNRILILERKSLIFQDRLVMGSLKKSNPFYDLYRKCIWNFKNMVWIVSEISDIELFGTFPIVHQWLYNA